MIRHRRRRGLLRSLAVAGATIVGGMVAASARPSPTLATSVEPPVVKTRRALDRLGDAALVWQGTFQCSGCHKQAETIAALAVARSSGYEAARPGVVAGLLGGLLTGSAGQGPDGCFSFSGSSVIFSTTVDGRGLEAYDTHLSSDHRSNLLSAADCLLDLQVADGSLPSDRTELPEAQGSFNTTGHGLYVWGRAREIDANGAYASAFDRAVLWLRGQIGSMESSPAAFTTQDKAMLLAGLGRSGAGPLDPDVARMHALLATDQAADGSWKLASTAGGGNAHATGQAVFALRTAGYARDDSVTDRGTVWLLDHEQSDGSWTPDFWTGGSPSSVAPSMWAAMALATYPSPLGGLRMSRGAAAIVSWSAVEGATTYDLVRGSTSSIVVAADHVDLGSVACLAAATELTSVDDGAMPQAGECFFYLMRIRWTTGQDIYGRSSGGLDEIPASGGCAP